MKNFLFISILILIITGCNRTIYVPVESVRSEFIDKLKSDSIYLHDSVFIRMKGDTIWYEKYRYKYKDRIVADSIFSNDTIRIPYPVLEIKEVNRLNSFQSFQIWCGRILMIILLGWLVIKYYRIR